MGLNTKSSMFSNYDLENLEAKSNDDSMFHCSQTHEINIHEASESGR